MYFCDLALGASFGADIPSGHTREEFNCSATAAYEVFLTFMPSKYILDGTRKTNVNLGPRGNQNQYWQACGVNMYYVEDFDFRSYFAAPIAKRDDMLLAVMECSLLDIASRFGADPKPIIDAIAATRECGCERRCLIPRLSRATKSRKLKLNVFRHIFHGGERWGIDITNRNGDVLQTQWISEEINSTDSASDFRKAAQQGDDFVIVGSLGAVSFRLNLKDLEESLLGMP
jgi:hypothetical protein